MTTMPLFSYLQQAGFLMKLIGSTEKDVDFQKPKMVLQPPQDYRK